MKTLDKYVNKHHSISHGNILYMNGLTNRGKSKYQSNILFKQHIRIPNKIHM